MDATDEIEVTEISHLITIFVDSSVRSLLKKISFK
jgi:hypothetical protein